MYAEDSAFVHAGNEFRSQIAVRQYRIDELIDLTHTGKRNLLTKVARFFRDVVDPEPDIGVHVLRDVVLHVAVLRPNLIDWTIDDAAIAANDDGLHSLGDGGCHRLHHSEDVAIGVLCVL